jgi:hypothetical protein
MITATYQIRLKNKKEDINFTWIQLSIMKKDSPFVVMFKMQDFLDHITFSRKSFNRQYPNNNL